MKQNKSLGNFQGSLHLEILANKELCWQCFWVTNAILTFEETSNSEDGDLDLAGCKVDVDIEINGKLLYESSWNDNTLDYDLQIGGTLQFAIFGENVTLVLNLIQSGNEGTGEFGGEVSFSIDGIPGGGYLVTTSEPWAGDVGGIQSGDCLSVAATIRAYALP